MNDLPLTLLRLGLLALLWIFIFSIVGVLRSDLYGTAISRRGQRRALARQEKAQAKAVKQQERAQPKPQQVTANVVSAQGNPAAAAVGAAAEAGSAASGSGSGTGSSAERGGFFGRGRAKATPTRLVVTEGPLTGTTLALRGSGVLIGRNPECALVLDDDYASGRHARLYPGSDGWMVEDLASTNGTYLDGSRLTSPKSVDIGAQLRIGQTVIELRS